MRNKLSEAGIMLGLVTLCSLFVCTVCFGQVKPFIDMSAFDIPRQNIIFEPDYKNTTLSMDQARQGTGGAQGGGPAHGERSTLCEIKSVEYLPVQADPVCY